VYTTKTIIIT